MFWIISITNFRRNITEHSEMPQYVRNAFGEFFFSYMKGADGVVITYDVTNRKSFDRVNFWRRLVESCDTVGPNVTYILIGNKCDLREERAVKAGEGLGEASKCNKCDPRAERALKAGEGLGEASNCLSK